MGDPWGIEGFRVEGAPGGVNREKKFGQKISKIGEIRKNRKNMNFSFDIKLSKLHWGSPPNPLKTQKSAKNSNIGEIKTKFGNFFLT